MLQKTPVYYKQYLRRLLYTARGEQRARPSDQIRGRLYRQVLERCRGVLCWHWAVAIGVQAIGVVAIGVVSIGAVAAGVVAI